MEQKMDIDQESEGKIKEFLRQYENLCQSMWTAKLMLIQAEEQLIDKESEKDAEEAVIFTKICSETNAEGKLVYTNEKQRESAVKVQLNKEKKELLDEIKIARLKVKNLQADLENTANKIKIKTHIIDYLASLNIVQAGAHTTKYFSI